MSGPLMPAHILLLDVLHDHSFLLLGLLCSLGCLSGNFLAFNGLDHTDGHRLPHVTHGFTYRGEDSWRRAPQPWASVGSV
uniref:Uncharacterized protein n=1 Tax=Gasterosteus aculeatus TaxID=69293 RepID=G3NC36_GASAC